MGRCNLKLLVVNYYYPQVGTSHGYRWGELCNELAKNGVEVDYLTSRCPFERVTVEGINLIEVGPKVRSSFVEGHKVGNGVKQGLKKNLGILGLINKRLKMLYRFFYWPDGLWFWFFPLISWYILNRGREYDAVITYSPTMVSHLFGLVFKINRGERIHWLADYGDPFSISYNMQPNNFRLYKRLNEKIECYIFDKADSVSFTNEETVSGYKKIHCLPKAMILNHAVNIDDYYVGKNHKGKKILRIAYVGGLHEGIREPYEPLRVLEAVAGIFDMHNKKLKVDMYGPLNGLEVGSEILTHHGKVSKCAAVDVVRGNNILLNIENKNCVMSPSKIVEYLATGKPIINYYYEEPHELFSKAAEYDGWVFNFNSDTNPENLYRFINKLDSFVAVTKSDVSTFLQDYENSYLAKKIMRIIFR